MPGGDEGAAAAAFELELGSDFDFVARRGREKHPGSRPRSLPPRQRRDELSELLLVLQDALGSCEASAALEEKDDGRSDGGCFGGGGGRSDDDDDDDDGGHDDDDDDDEDDEEMHSAQEGDEGGGGELADTEGPLRVYTGLEVRTELDEGALPDGKPIWDNTDLRGGDLRTVEGVHSVGDCAAACAEHDDGSCVAWTLSKAEGYCWLKTLNHTRLDVNKSDSLISGLLAGVGIERAVAPVVARKPQVGQAHTKKAGTPAAAAAKGAVQPSSLGAMARKVKVAEVVSAAPVSANVSNVSRHAIVPA